MDAPEPRLWRRRYRADEIYGNIPMTQNGLYALIVVLVIAVVGLGIAYTHEASKTSGIHIQAGDRGLSIEKKN